MHIHRVVVAGREFGEFKVVGGKQAKGLGFVVQLGGNGAGQGQAVKGGRAPANLVHQHQRLRRGAVQNLRRLHHLQHEGGLRVGQIIGCANAGVDGVNRPQAAGAGRHIRAHAGQQHNQRHLAHVGGFAAHVWAGDDLQTLAWPELGVVGDEVAAAQFCQASLHHRMAALGDVDAGVLHKLRCAPAQGERTLGQRAQRVQRGQRARQAGKRRNIGLQGVQYLLKQPLFAGQGALLGAQGFVFKGFEFGGDKALGVFQGLAAAVVLGHFAGLTLGHFNIEAVDLVELHAQIGNAGACALAGFQVQQKGVAVGLDGAQLVEFGVKTAGNHAAITHQRGGLWGNGALQQIRAARWRQQIGGDAIQQSARGAQPGQRLVVGGKAC